MRFLIGGSGQDSKPLRTFVDKCPSWISWLTFAGGVLAVFTLALVINLASKLAVITAIIAVIAHFSGYFANKQR